MAPVRVHSTRRQRRRDDLFDRVYSNNSGTPWSPEIHFVRALRGNFKRFAARGASMAGKSARGIAKSFFTTGTTVSLDYGSRKIFFFIFVLISHRQK